MPPFHADGKCDLYHSATFFASSDVEYTLTLNEVPFAFIDISWSLCSAAPG